MHRRYQRKCCTEPLFVVDVESAGSLQRGLTKIRRTRRVVSPAAAVKDIQAVGLLHRGRRIVAKRSERTDDQPRIPATDVGRTYLEAFQITGRVIGHNCIHPLDQGVQSLLSASSSDVQTDG